jgi:tetratricopeptide (TPR) repeat protein
LISLALAPLASREPDIARAGEALNGSLALFREVDDAWGQAMALVTIGRVEMLTQDVPGALARFEESLALARRQRDDLGVSISLHHRGWAKLLLGDLDTALICFEECLSLSAALHHDEGVAYALEGLTAVAGAAGDPGRAGTLLGAAQVVRERTGLYNAPSFSFHQAFVDGILAGPAADAFESARERGRHLHVDDAVAYALARDRVEAAASAT